MKSLTAVRLIKILETNGFLFSRQNGSHAIYKNGLGVIVIIPIHGKSRLLKIGTFLSIVKQSKLPKNLFK